MKTNNSDLWRKIFSSPNKWDWNYNAIFLSQYSGLKYVSWLNHTNVWKMTYGIQNNDVSFQGCSLWQIIAQIIIDDASSNFRLHTHQLYGTVRYWYPTIPDYYTAQVLYPSVSLTSRPFFLADVRYVSYLVHTYVLYYYFAVNDHWRT